MILRVLSVRSVDEESARAKFVGAYLIAVSHGACGASPIKPFLENRRGREEGGREGGLIVCE